MYLGTNAIIILCPNFSSTWTPSGEWFIVLIFPRCSYLGL